MIAKDLRILYMGTPDFAVEPLKRLTENGYNIVGVVTVPDKPAGRGQKLRISAVKHYAQQQNIRVLQPEKLRDPEFIKQIEELNPDLSIVVAFRMLPEIVWRIPRLGTFNLHASLLPDYRGAAPINWAIINGDKVTGVTTFLIDKEIDTGNILLRQQVDIDDNDSAGDLHDKLMLVGANLVEKTVIQLAEGKINPIPQHEFIDKLHVSRPVPKLFKDTTKINWNEPASNVHNFIRGLSPYPAAWCQLTNEHGESVSVKIFRSELVKVEGSCSDMGKITTDGKSFLHIACKQGTIGVKQLQLAGKRRLDITDFLSGFRDIKRYCFT